MKRFVIATALMCALVLPVAAGDIHTTDSQIPAPSPTPQGVRSDWSPVETSTPGDVHTGDSAQPSVQDVLDALLSVFGLVF